MSWVRLDALSLNVVNCNVRRGIAPLFAGEVIVVSMGIRSLIAVYLFFFPARAVTVTVMLVFRHS